MTFANLCEAGLHPDDLAALRGTRKRIVMNTFRSDGGLGPGPGGPRPPG
jgi:hypothetical protein